MKNQNLHLAILVFAASMLLVASLACDAPGGGSPPPGTVTPYLPGGGATEVPTTEPTTPPTVAVVETPPTAGGPNLMITAVTLSTNTPAVDGWVVVDVTIQNQGTAAANDFELVLIPHYGWGPPNPAGYELLPSIAAGASHTVNFSPGVLYSDAGTFTLRVLVTDDWGATGNPDSTGSAGDIWDETITVAAPPTASGPNLMITAVTLSTNTPAVDGWVVVDVTIQNQGGAAANDFELVLIPHYGWGPPNPAGYETLPSIAPGASHTVSFSPGVLYVNEGTFTLRVLVTDDWYATGNPDSTGSAGDIWDETITVAAPPTTSGPNLVITGVTLSTHTPALDGWVVVDVTIQNQGGAAANDLGVTKIG